ncbi:hypothetical protein [Evansella tamaricis]|uniref:Uncharacterized protein n=1 Tax=Evansella tamaricis TaxID=2069301 RepID=A0ABS6JB20_9BACI|nr:hypothetical protein [Evansella tamaricis]MBU9710741.1 hypothetical protein [Evansella tamaricis]
MNRLDEQMKELRELQRGEEARMRTYHRAKGELYEKRIPVAGQGRSTGLFWKKMLIPLAVLSAVFIGFLITYQWFQDGGFGLTPAEDEENQEEQMESFTIDGEIDSANITLLSGDGTDRSLLNQVGTVTDAAQLERLREILNGPSTIVPLEEEETSEVFETYEVILDLNNGDTIEMEFSITPLKVYVSLTDVTEPTSEQQEIYEYGQDLAVHLKTIHHEALQEDEEDDHVAQEEDNDNNSDQETEETFVPVEKYAVFADYELEHIGPLAESATFLFGETYENYVLGYGHQAHAVMKFEVYEVDEENDRVSIIRRINEDSSDYDHIQDIMSRENWADDMISFILETGEPLEETFFVYDASVTETIITMNDQTYAVYPVETGVEGKINYFKAGEGLWMKLHADQMTIDFLEEPQQATRITE